MLDLFSQFSGFLKFDTVCIDNNVFRLHYKATVMILVCASVLVTSRQYIGDPIDCMADVSNNKLKNSEVNMFQPGYTWRHHGHILLDPRYLLHTRTLGR